MSQISAGEVRYQTRLSPTPSPSAGQAIAGHALAVHRCYSPLRPALGPIIFSAVADALEWVVKSRRAGHVFHYVDDFIFVGPPQLSDCHRDLHIFSQSCSTLGVTIADEKTEEPATCLTVLGIEVDSRAMELMLPQEKLRRVKELLLSWRGRKYSRNRDLEFCLGFYNTLQRSSGLAAPSYVAYITCSRKPITLRRTSSCVSTRNSKPTLNGGPPSYPHGTALPFFAR